MRLTLLGLVASITLASFGSAPALATPEPGTVARPMIELDSPEGWALLDRTTAVDFEPLHQNWVAQLKSHCGAASAVVVNNALRPADPLTQDCLFTPETAHIITQDVVYRIGFTLEELTEMIKTRTGLEAERFHAGTDEGHHDYAAFRAALLRNRESPDDQLIINFPVRWLSGEGNRGGHFSPIAEFNEAENMVLVLEINQTRPIFWVDAEHLWESLATVDRVSGMNRGWIVVRRPEGSSGGTPPIQRPLQPTAPMAPPLD